MLKISLKFLNKEKQNTLFYLVFLILSQTAMAFYLNLALNPAYQLSFDVAFATICLAIALYVLVLSFYAAKRYIETEVPLLGIFKLCGVSLSGMMHFISLQLIFIIGIAFLAVSYTHLDVYKRQTIRIQTRLGTARITATTPLISWLIQ